MEKNFEIGQVVYILSEQSQSILPGIVAEEVVVKKLSGNSVSWKIKVGHAEKAKLYDSSKIKGEVYGSLEEVREVMTKRLNEFIFKISQDAQDRVEKWYGKEIADQAKHQQEILEQTRINSVVGETPSSGFDDRIDPDALLNAIENRPQAQKFIPEPSPPLPASKAELRQRLKEMATADDEGSGEGEMFVSLPSGERMQVRMQKPKLS